MGDLYHSGPTSSIGVPTRHSHYENGAFSTPGGGSHGMTLPMPTDFGTPGLSANYVSGNTHSDHASDGLVQDTNGFYTHHVPQNLGEWVKGDTAYGLPTFIEHTPPSYRVANQRLNPLKMYGISMWNQRMKYDKDWRETYGSQLSICEVLKKFGIIGIQQSRETLVGAGGSWCQENNFYVRGRARVPNLWLAQSYGNGTRGHIGEMAVLYVVYRRHRFMGDSRVNDDVDMLLPPPRKRKADDKNDKARHRTWQPGLLELEAERQRDAPVPDDVGVLAQAIVDSEGRDNPFADLANTKIEVDIPVVKLKQEGVRTDEYYWSCDVWTSYDKQPPPPALYTGSARDPNNLFIGDYRHIGQVTHVSRGPNNRTPRNVELAREALYPENRDDSYLNSLYTVDEIEVNLGCGRCY